MAYFIFENFLCLGRLSFHNYDGYRITSSEKIIPVAKEHIIETDISTSSRKERKDLITGYLSEEKFYECPLLVFYCEFSKFSIIDQRYDSSFSFDLKIYDKKFLNSRKLKFHYKFSSLNISHLFNIINIINEYIDKENDINLLEPDKINIYSGLCQSSFIEFSTIDKLEFKHFANSRNRVGKDNVFWSEIEIRNLPNNSYIRSLLFNSLKEIKFIFRLKDQKDFFIMELEEEYAYTSSFNRYECAPDVENENLIRNYLKIFMYNNYNYKEHYFSKMKKNIE